MTWNERIIVSVVIAPLFLGLEGSNLLRNGDFESFSSGEPTGWTTNNIPTMLSVVTASQNSYAGKVSVRCEVKDFYGTKMAGMISQKNLEVGEGELQLRGAYLLKSQRNDAGFVGIDVKTAGNSTVATCERYLTEAKGGFVLFSFSTKLPKEAKRIDILFTLMPEKHGRSLHIGSYILFDAVELSFQSSEGTTVQ
jgi:hypothetical protein